jgi:hypothetical protein
MYFCPQCSYLLDIGKASIESAPSTIIITKPIELFKLLEKNEFNSKIHKYDGDYEELVKHKNYKNLSNDIKNIIKSLSSATLHFSSVEFKCANCSYANPIHNTVLLYKMNVIENYDKDSTLEHNKLMSKDPILPHTRDYTCKNLKCATHANDELKDAVFYKKRDNYRAVYICTVCYYSW